MRAALRAVGLILIGIGAVGLDRARKRDDGWALAVALVGIGTYVLLIA